jgi:hypothetical protein
LFFQGNPDWPMVDVRLSPFNDLFSTVSYGDFKGYQHLAASGQLKIGIYQFGTMNKIAQFAPMDLAAYKGQSLTLFTKRGASAGSVELWAARADGTTFQMTPTVGTSEIDGATTQVRVFPNPTTSDLNMQVLGSGSGAIQYRVLDAQGRVVLTSSAEGIGDAQIYPISVSNLAAGLYFLEVNSLSGSHTVRFGKM